MYEATILTLATIYDGINDAFQVHEHSNPSDSLKAAEVFVIVDI